MRSVSPTRSSASRFAAGAAGYLNLSQSGLMAQAWSIHTIQKRREATSARYRRRVASELLHPRTVGQHEGGSDEQDDRLVCSQRRRFDPGCVAGWAVSDTQARIATPTTVQIDPFTMMTSAKQLPAEHFADYSFVF